MMPDVETLGLRGMIYPTADLQAAKAWFAQAFGVEPDFDEPFYVGFTVAGYHVGLMPTEDDAQGPRTYWGVADIDASWADLMGTGATEPDGPRQVGDGIRLAEAITPEGHVLGLIENQHFALPNPPPRGDGPGR